MDVIGSWEKQHGASLQLFCQEAMLGVQTAYIVYGADIICPWWVQQILLLMLLLRNWYIRNMAMEQVCIVAVAIYFARLQPFPQYCPNALKLANVLESLLPLVSMTFQSLSSELSIYRLILFVFFMIRYIMRLAALYLLWASFVWGSVAILMLGTPALYLLYNLKRFVEDPSQQPFVVRALFKTTTFSVRLYLYLKHDILPQTIIFLQSMERPFLMRAHEALDQEEKYIYRDLEGPQEFRILILERRVPFKLPRARLETVKYANRPRFVACSYVWGDPTPCKRIIIDGKRLDLPESSFNLISHQQSFFRRRNIWIDAVCVSQESATDKSHSIPRMRSIYQYADYVDAYLSYETRNTKLAWLFTKLWYWGWIRHNLGLGYSSLFNAEREGEHQEVWKELVHLFELQWFYRAWILQEVAVPKLVYLNHGMIRIRWDIFARTLAVLERPALKAGLKKARNASLGHSQARIMDEVRKIVQSGEAESLTDLLFRCRGFMATNPRDKVYGMLGLVTEEMRSMVRVDYGSDVGTVFARTMRVIIRESGMKALLACDGIRNAEAFQNIPSWVPDWSSHDHPNWWNSSVPWRAATGVGAGKRPMAMNEEAGDSPLLAVEIKVVDSIRLRGLLKKPFSVDSEEGSMRERQRLLTQAWNSAKKHCLRHYDTEDNLREGFWRTLLSDYDFETRERASAFLEDDYNIYDWMLNIGGDFETSRWHRYYQNGNVFLEEEGMSRSDMEDKLERMMKFREKTDVNAWRRLGFTTTGRLATFPVGTQAGDEICLIAGAPAPFVTRKQYSDNAWDEEHRVLVGYAYVNGIMDGELADGPWQACSFV